MAYRLDSSNLHGLMPRRYRTIKAAIAGRIRHSSDCACTVDIFDTATKTHLRLDDEYRLWEAERVAGLRRG